MIAKTTLTVALLQLTPIEMNLPVSLEKGEQHCRLARTLGADVALFPEMWSNGYFFFDEITPEILEQWRASAIDQKHAYFKHFQTLAHELKLAIGLTYLEARGTALYDSFALIDRHGEVVLNYAKVHTLDMNAVEALCTPGEGFAVCDLDTGSGAVKVGAMICFDCFFPESARILMLKGAEVVLSPNADGLNADKLAVFRTRAYENMLGFATANYALPACNGRSVAYDGMAYEEGHSRNMQLVQAGESETVVLARFDIARLRQYRIEESYGNKWRRPSQYDLIGSQTGVVPEFERIKGRR